ncbi:hypothetical protein F4604DRAFT_2043227 [Suillus subluteus]|nr:hypothetical protein F4604DRAFT_2043227 [Suillus subluteus]
MSNYLNAARRNITTDGMRQATRYDNKITTAIKHNKIKQNQVKSKHDPVLAQPITPQTKTDKIKQNKHYNTRMITKSSQDKGRLKAIQQQDHKKTSIKTDATTEIIAYAYANTASHHKDKNHDSHRNSYNSMRSCQHHFLKEEKKKTRITMVTTTEIIADTHTNTISHRKDKNHDSHPNRHNRKRVAPDKQDRNSNKTAKVKECQAIKSQKIAKMKQDVVKSNRDPVLGPRITPSGKHQDTHTTQKTRKSKTKPQIKQSQATTQQQYNKNQAKTKQRKKQERLQ